METWTQGHEKLCADRYRLLLASIGVGMTIILTAGGFGLTRLLDRNDTQAQALQTISSTLVTLAAHQQH